MGTRSEGQVMKLVWEVGRRRGPRGSREGNMSRRPGYYRAGAQRDCPGGRPNVSGQRQLSMAPGGHRGHGLTSAVQEGLCVRNGNEDQGGAPPSSLRKKPAKKRSEIRRWGSRLLRPIHLRGAETYLSQPETWQSERDAPRVCTACSQNSNRIHLQTIPSH